MQTVKEFLEQEYANLYSALDETLRFKYGLEGSQDFFDECRVRLSYIRSELTRTLESDENGLQQISILLIQLSSLISRIERSSLGQYSWPFVEELKRIGNAICTEATLTNPNTPPQFYVLSGGGLDTYAIEPEQNRPSGGNRRIHTIVFPRTVRHFVLLHSILGHELGHAMWRCSQYQNALRQILDTHLFAHSPFADPTATANWPYAATAPPIIKAQLAQIAPAVNANNFFLLGANWHAWREEVLCDFIGLLTFGPSFIAAEAHLLYSLDLSGSLLGPRHPPVGWRVNYLLTAAKECGFSNQTYTSPKVDGLANAFWSNLETKRQSDSWYDVFSATQIQNTVSALRGLLSPLPPSLYASPTESDLDFLVSQLMECVPPVGYALGADGTVSLRQVDFRHSLYAGWIVSANRPSITFSQLNRLCEHGIMQQRAIELQMSTPPT